MDNLRVGLVLHFYQPWWQSPVIVKKIVNQCYRPIIQSVNRLDRFCFTANINLSLLLHLENEYPDVVEGFREASQAGRIELTGSTAQHPIIPLVNDENLQIAQIEEDQRLKKDKFGIMKNCHGIFMPEMAFSSDNIPLLKKMGYRWTVTDDTVFASVHGFAPSEQIVTWDGFKVYMRSGLWSNRVSSGHLGFEDFKNWLGQGIMDWTHGNDAYLILAMDAETFGHHHLHLIDTFLNPMMNEWAGNKIVQIQSLEKQFPPMSVNYLPGSSWSTSADDHRRSDPYPLWNSRFNKYHSMLWELTSIALKYFDSCREDCLKITSSCHWWWISGRPHWEPEFMKKGVRKAMDIVRNHGSQDEVRSAERIFWELIELH